MQRISKVTKPIWLSIFETLEGIQEVPGPGSNPVILIWAKAIGAPGWYKDDDQAWCALVMNRVLLAAQQPMSGKGFDLLRAQTFEHYGEEILGPPALGCIMVFNRPGGYHVGLYLGERKDAYLILGGNQSNAVSKAWIPKGRLIAQRWPEGEPVTNVGRIWLNPAGVPLSANEV